MRHKLNLYVNSRRFLSSSLVQLRARHAHLLTIVIAPRHPLAPMMYYQDEIRAASHGGREATFRGADSVKSGLIRCIPKLSRIAPYVSILSAILLCYNESHPKNYQQHKFRNFFSYSLLMDFYSCRVQDSTPEHVGNPSFKARTPRSRHRESRLNSNHPTEKWPTVFLDLGFSHCRYDTRLRGICLCIFS